MRVMLVVHVTKVRFYIKFALTFKNVVVFHRILKEHFQSYKSCNCCTWRLKPSIFFKLEFVAYVWYKIGPFKNKKVPGLTIESDMN